jgi:tetratricopeptide (TPR) repeat protein
MERVAKHIEQGVANHRGNVLTNTFDCEVLMDRIVANLGIPAKVREDVHQSLFKVLQQADVELARTVSHFELLKVRVKNDEVRALYRAEVAQGGLNYYDVLLVRSADGCVRIGDIFVYLLASDISQTVRQPLMVSVKHANRGILDRLTGKESALVTNWDIVKAMKIALSNKDYEGVLVLYHRLPTEAKDHRIVLEMRILAAQQINEQEYAEAIDAMARHADGNPAINLLLIDAFLVRKQYESALAAIEKLDAAVGTDPRLDGLRASLLCNLGKHDDARQAIDRALKAFPDRRDVHEFAVVVAAAQNRFEHVLYELHLLETEFNFGLAFENDPRFTGFVESPQYQTWKVQHEAPENISQATGFDLQELR